MSAPTPTAKATLTRFTDAQAPVIAQVLRELKAGQKTTHWMWFVFPQIHGLGTSPMAQRYAIASMDEARAYLADPVLRKTMPCLLRRLSGSLRGRRTRLRWRGFRACRGHANHWASRGEPFRISWPTNQTEHRP